MAAGQCSRQGLQRLGTVTIAGMQRDDDLSLLDLFSDTRMVFPNLDIFDIDGKTWMAAKRVLQSSL